MSEIYRKRGSVVRYENGVIVSVREAGESIDDGVLFRCAPTRRQRLPERSVDDLLRFIDGIRSNIPDDAIERLTAMDGFAEHECGGRQWTDRQVRVHLSLVSSSLRVIVNEARFDAAAIARIYSSLVRATPPRPAPARMRLAPAVVAALVPSLIGVAGTNCSIEQVPGRVDGKGNDIVRTAGPEWPNWYRPSYRSRPRRVPLNVELKCNAIDVEPRLPRAIALLASPEGLTVHALCEDGGDVFPTRLDVVRIEGTLGEATWYPVAAGVYARETVVVCR